ANASYEGPPPPPPSPPKGGGGGGPRFRRYCGQPPVGLFSFPDARRVGGGPQTPRGARAPRRVVAGLLPAPRSPPVAPLLSPAAGKTTLVRRFLATPEGAGTAVVTNEFGSVGIDDALMRASTDDVTLLGNGCLCCNPRSDLQNALRNLVAERAQGTLPPFTRI